MFHWKIGQQRIVREEPNEGAGGGGAGAAHPVQAPWASAEGVWSVGEGEQAQPWHALIPEEDARKHVEAKGYKNPAELALANYSLTKMQRGDPTVVGIPGEGASQEDWDAFYGKLGRPDQPAGYEFQFGEGVQVDDKMVEFGRNTFHKAGLTPQQAQIVADAWNEFASQSGAEAQQQVSQQNEQEIRDLETRWGADLDKNKAAGQRAVKALGISNDLIERVENSIGSAAIVELLASIGRKSDEGGFTSGTENGDPTDPANMNSQQAEARITALRGDAEFQKKFNDPHHPGHKDAVEEMQRLYAKI